MVSAEQPIHILAIDDSVEDVDLIQTVLNRNPYYKFSIISANNAAEALRIYDQRKQEIDCILLDYRLPDMDGLDLLNILKDKQCRAPVIVLTGFGSYELDLDFMKMGAADYLSKDEISSPELERKIRYAIEKSKIITNLQELNADRETFLATLSHEIKNSLTSVIGYADLLKNEENGNSKQSHYLTRIIESAKYLNTLLENTLKMALLSKRTLKLVNEEYDIVECVSFCISLEAPKAKAKNLPILFTTFDPVIKLKGDRNRIIEAIQNILNNAIKFTDKGEIVVDIKKKADSVELKIKDSGIGMTEEQIKKTFLLFSQGNDKIYHKYGGSGLGLAIAKEFITLHRGSIQVNSKVGEGSEFIISLPLN